MKKSIFNRLKNDLWVVVMDAIAVNAAYILALLLRYYVHSEFKSAALAFVDTYMRFAPFYTAICLVLFYLFGLYDGIWRYAGLNDMNRIIIANVIAVAANILGTKLFFGGMPRSYYFVGGALQFLLIVIIRFSYRFLQERKQQNERQRSWSIPAMVVGSGDCGKAFIRYLDEKSPFQAVVIAGKDSGKMMNGIPIVDYGSIPIQIQYHGIQAVFIADEEMTEEKKAEIKAAAGGVEVRDYIEYLSDMMESVSMNALLKVIDGPVTVVINGVERQYGNARECMVALGNHYEVCNVSNARIEVREL